MPITVLIVDDSAASRQVIAYHLRQAGCAIAGEASTAADALALTRELHPNIVSLDLMMPVKDGLDSMALVRAIKKETPQTAFIVVSVISSEKMRRDFIQEGVFAYVVKPFNDFAMRAIAVKLRRTFPELGHVKGWERSTSGH
jgi:two-component system chemotaxis response regulator CheY